MVSEIGEFKGNKILKLKKDENDGFGMSFGVRKAQLILDNLEDIKAFVEGDTK